MSLISRFSRLVMIFTFYWSGSVASAQLNVFERGLQALGLSIPASQFSSQAFTFSPDLSSEQNLQWVRMTIPGAKCGNGDDYPVFIDRQALQLSTAQRSRRILFLFQGGGVCYNKETCLGENRSADLRAPEAVIPYANEIYGDIKDQGIYSGQSTINGFLGFSKVYFPYCTGDVFMGRHEADYEGEKVLHVGHSNIEKAVQFFLSNPYLFDFHQTENISLNGFSAGAIGALNHLPTFAPAVPWTAQKSVIADAPGLHFGDTFWQKFSSEFLQDVELSFARFGYALNRNSGLVADIVPRVCQTYPTWNIGTLQGTDDAIMSVVYGDHDSVETHAAMVLAPGGIHDLTSQPGDNCVAWIEEGQDNYGRSEDEDPSISNFGNHTYFISDDTALIRVQGKSSMEFAWDVTHGYRGSNFVGVTDPPEWFAEEVLEESSGEGLR